MRRSFALVGFLVAATACTGGATPRPTPAPTGTLPPPQAAALTLDVVAPTTGHEADDDRSYLDGMRLAVEDVNATGGVAGRRLDLRITDDGGDQDRAGQALRSVERGDPLAVLFVGPGPVLGRARAFVVDAGNPVVLLQGDLYTSGQLFDQVFQTTIPWTWQVHVIARYLVRDRKAKDIVFVGSGPEAATASRATAAALTYWGGRLAASYVTPPASGTSPPTRPATTADAAVVFGSPSDARGIVGSLTSTSHHPRIAGGASLLSGTAGAAGPPPGTTACYTYTWAGWAKPIPRVGRFIDRITQSFGHPPVGFEQEGYDAIRTLATALARTGGRGGNVLISALEGVDKTFSSFPVNLGPDDHLFLPRDELGLFAVPGPDERLDPWQTPGGTDWRALMRTFTIDGQRDNLLDRDRPVFFPRWKAPQPGPPFWKSRYGIVTRSSDQLH